MKKNSTLFLIIAVLMLNATSCKKNNKPSAEGKELILTEREQQKAEADNAFTFKLFKETLSKPLAGKNLMLSPLSVSMALGMTSNGSNGTTLESIRNTMEFKGFTETELNSYYHKIITELPQLDPKASLKIANSIWCRNTFSPLPAFLKVNADNYNAAVEGLDFSNPAAKDKINNWVNTSTNGKIPTIIESIGPSIVMYLINAVYFKSEWKYKFDKNRTAKSDFSLGDGSKIQTDFMVAKADVNYLSSADAVLYELPYGNEKYSMVIALPAANTGINELAISITTTKWKNWMTGLRKIGAEIKMPKFKFSYESKLNDPLINLGMGIAFGKNGSADFSRISAGGGLQIDEVKHKTFIEVNESGTEAAAVTSVGIELTSAPGVATPILIDRPFVFAIREMKTGLILFTGIINNPLLDK
ncbi:serpin family protein [Pedobacter africanus]|uniref:Serpin B n=1 Tax=Pedobacter africanus TaxID=151894 RepID=A0A1W2DF68_9SPHI|nr:serpin family protein [Pedobacter africanus]SMC95598.1 serpin B [Pedobacter africanus]